MGTQNEMLGDLRIAALSVSPWANMLRTLLRPATIARMRAAGHGQSWLPLFAVAGLALTSVPAAARSASAGMVTYSVVKGDTLFDLSARYLTATDGAQILQRLNHVADPRRMPVGLVLRVPERLLRQELVRARIRSFGGPVQISIGGRAVPALAGMSLVEGNGIQTGANAYISLDLPDGSVVTMPSQSRVGIAWLRRTLLTGSISRRFDVTAGRLRAVVTPMTDPRSDFKVSTPVAVAAVRGTEFRVSYDAGQVRATTEVITGKVEVTGAKRPGALVPAGYGALARPDSGVSAPVALLPAPVPVDPSRGQSDETLSFAVAPVPGATGYRLQIARDAGFLDLLSETDSVEPRFVLPGIPDGTYFSRIAAIDASGFEGQSNVYGFQRRLHALTTSMEQRDRSGRREYLFRWREAGAGTYVYRFQLNRCGATGSPLIDQANVANFALAVTDLPSGNYCWRVQSVPLDGSTKDVIWSDTKTFTIAG